MYFACGSNMDFVAGVGQRVNSNVLNGGHFKDIYTSISLEPGNVTLFGERSLQM